MKNFKLFFRPSRFANNTLKDKNKNFGSQSITKIFMGICSQKIRVLDKLKELKSSPHMIFKRITTKARLMKW